MSRSVVGLVVGLVISALAFWWALPPDGLRSLPGYLASANSTTLLLAVVVATSTFVIRAARWRLLLRAEAGQTVSWHAAWHATTIGFMANNVLPLRLGEVIRALAVSRLSATRLPAALVSIAVERVFDALAVVALFALALTSTTLPTDVMIGDRSAGELVRLIGVLGILAIVAAILAGLFPDPVERMMRRVIPWTRFADTLAGVLRSFAHGLRVLHDPKRILLVAVSSLFLWVVNAWSFGLAFQAFGLPGGMAAAILLQTFVVFAVAAPAAPGFAGVFEGAIVLGGAVLGVPQAAAFAAAVVYHVLTYIPITLLGAWSLKETGLKLGELKEQQGPGA